MKRKSIIFLVIFVHLIVGIFFYFSFKTKNRTTKWRTATVEKGDIIITVTATGSINADTTVQVGTQVSGRISKLFADFNSVVKKGQIIAIPDTTFLTANKEDVLYQTANMLTKMSFRTCFGIPQMLKQVQHDSSIILIILLAVLY